MDENASDQALVRRVWAGESVAYGKIVARYQPSLLSVAWATLGNAEDAADAVQDALVLAYLHLNQLKDPTRLGAWLRRITANACRRQMRARKPTASLDAIAETGLSDTQAIDTRLLIEQALTCLSVDTRLTLMLYYQRELSLEEIAAFQEVPVTTIKSRLRNARARLRKELETLLEETMTQKRDDLLPRVLHRIEAQGGILSLAVSHDGTRLVTGAALEVTDVKFDARIAAWDLATGNPLWTTELTSWFRSVLFTPGDHSVAIATGLPGRRDGYEGRILFLDTATGESIRELKTLSGPFALALSPDGRYVAAGHRLPYQDAARPWRHGDEGVLCVYDLATGEPAHVLKPHLNQIGSVAFSPDGKTLASDALLRDADPEAEDIWLREDVRIWDLATGTKRRQLDRPNARGTTHNIAISPDGALLAAPNGSEGEVLLWDVVSGVLMRTLQGFGSHVYTLAFSPDGTTLATGGPDTRVRLFDSVTGQLRETLEGHIYPVRTLTFTPEGARLITADSEGSVRIWQLRSAG